MLISLHPNNFPSTLQNNRPLVPKTFFLASMESLMGTQSQIQNLQGRLLTKNERILVTTPTEASLLESPVSWAARLCIYNALIRAGLAGSPRNPFVSDFVKESDDTGLFKWFGNSREKSEEKEASDKRKFVSKWHPTTKGTLKRSYRVPSQTVGRRLLKAIAAVLSDDDQFRDATSHKGCQIRRETAHGESVCCNNVRALFDELPTPHLVVEITAFPAGPLTEKDYAKAEKLEKVLRTAASI